MLAQQFAYLGYSPGDVDCLKSPLRGKREIQFGRLRLHSSSSASGNTSRVCDWRLSSSADFNPDLSSK